MKAVPIVSSHSPGQIPQLFSRKCKNKVLHLDDI
jgi:hypothetical protein